MSHRNPEDLDKFLRIQPTIATSEQHPNISIKISRYDKIRAAVTGLAVGYLTYEHVPYIPEDSAKVTLGIITGIGAAALDAYAIPVIEAHRARQ